jgi:hypothetical protein
MSRMRVTKRGQKGIRIIMVKWAAMTRRRRVSKRGAERG